MSSIARLTLVIVSLCLVVPSYGEDSSDESANLAEIVPASYVDLYTPYFSVAGRDSTNLVFVTAVSEPVEVEITAFNAKGDPLPVGRFTIPVSQHLSLDLKTLVQPASRDFWQGSLRVSYIGSVETLQAWVLLGFDGQLTEFTLLARPEAPVNSLMTFWGTSHGAIDLRRALYLLNAGTRPVRYTTASSHRGMARERSRVIGAGERQKLVLAGSGPGWIRVDHDGNPGDLIGLSLDRGSSRARVVPVWTVPSEQVSTWEAIRVPVVGSAGATTGALTLFNGADERVEAQIAVLADTGAELLETRLQLEPGEVRDVALSNLLGSVQVSEVRLRVSGDRPGILVQGVAATPGGGLSELSFFAHDKVHASGTYPILPVDQYSTDVTLVNLGPDQSEVVVPPTFDRRRHGGGYRRSARPRPP